MTLGLCFDDIN